MWSFIFGHVLKFGLIHTKDFGVMGFKVRGCVFSHIFSTPRGETASDANKFCRCKNGIHLLYPHVKFGEARTSHAAGGWAKKFTAPQKTEEIR